MKHFYQKYVLTTALALVAFATQSFAQTDWAGTYTLKSNDPMVYNTETYDVVGDYGLTDKMPNPESYTIVIEKQGDDYVVTKFADFDLTAELADGPITLQVKDAKTAYIPTDDHALYGYTFQYEGEDEDGEPATLTGTIKVLIQGQRNGMNSADEPLKVTKQSDGQIKLANFVLQAQQTGQGKAILGWYDKNTPLNGGDPDEAVVAYDWAGTYLVTNQNQFSMDETLGFPEQYLMTIAEDPYAEGAYVITEFWGRDNLGDVTLNWMTGGIPLTLDEEDGDVAYIAAADGQNLLETTDGGFNYYALSDAFGIGEPIQITHNDDDTFTIDGFNLVTYSLTGAESETLVYCFGATAVKGDREALEEQLTSGISEIGLFDNSRFDNSAYDLQGRKLPNGSLRKGLNIVKFRQTDGTVITKKVLVK